MASPRHCTNLGATLDHLGRHREALDAAQEAVDLYRPLAAANPDAHQARPRRGATQPRHPLAPPRPLSRGTRRHPRSHRPSTGPLAAANPDAHQPGLARALINLGARTLALSAATARHSTPRRKPSPSTAPSPPPTPTPYQPDLAYDTHNLEIELSHLTGRTRPCRTPGGGGRHLPRRWPNATRSCTSPNTGSTLGHCAASTTGAAATPRRSALTWTAGSQPHPFRMILLFRITARTGS